jgi:hypothetical protein
VQHRKGLLQRGRLESGATWRSSVPTNPLALQSKTTYSSTDTYVRRH